MLSSRRLHSSSPPSTSLWSDAADNAYFFSDEKNEALLQAVGEKWKNENYFDRTPLPNKYQKILEIGEKPLFEENDPDYSGIKDLIGIRNYLMHYRREWIVIQTDRTPGAHAETHAEKFERLLKNRFDENPLAPQNLPFFPDRVSWPWVCRMGRNDQPFVHGPVFPESWPARSLRGDPGRTGDAVTGQGYCQILHYEKLCWYPIGKNSKTGSGENLSFQQNYKHMVTGAVPRTAPCAFQWCSLTFLAGIAPEGMLRVCGGGVTGFRNPGDC